MVTALIDVALTLVGLTVLNWRLGLAGLAPLPIWVLTTRWYLRTSGRATPGSERRTAPRPRAWSAA